MAPRPPSVDGRDRVGLSFRAFLFVRFAGEEQYHWPLINLFGRYGGEVEPATHVQLVAFLSPFDRWYSVADRVQWGENSAKESSLQ